MRPLVRTAAPLALLLVLSASGSAQDVPGAHPDRLTALDPELREEVERAGAPPIDVFLVLREQPAADVAAQLRPEYAARVDAVLAPTRAALVRIAPDLPSRAERAGMPVPRQIALEDALLRPDERDARVTARREAARLLAEMRAAIRAEAWRLVAAEQGAIAAHVADLPGGRVLARTAVMNALVVRVRPEDLPDLLRIHPGIARVAPARRRAAAMDVSGPVTGAGDWTSVGVDGSGQKVAVVDTGIDGTHPALEDADGDSVVVGAAVYLEEAAAESDFDDDDTDTDDLHGHGTHIAGTIASQDGTYGGVAPGARLLNAKCFYRTSSGGGAGLDPDIVEATDWALDAGATVLSLSFGGDDDSDGSSALTRFYDAVAHVTGVPVAVAAGNGGPSTGSVGPPGDGFNAVTVGAFDDKGSTSTSDDTLAGFSSRGPTDDGRLKPDVIAPGVTIRSTNHAWEGSGADFVSKSGTSMATPHVAAGIALLLDHESDWQPEAVKALLLNSVRTASPVGTTPGTAWGFGAIDLARAYAERDLVATATLTSSGSDTLFFALSGVSSGDHATLVWNRSAAFSSSGRASGAGAAKTLVDLDLVLYGADGVADDAGASDVDPVEQVAAPAAASSAVLKVERVGAFPSGQTSVDLALASAAEISAVQPPALAVTLGAPQHVAGGGQLTLTATVANSGGLAATAPELGLALPAGWSVASGGTTRGASDVAPGAQAQVTWTVVAPSSTGSGALAVSASSSCWGETFAAATATVSVRADATPPQVDAGDDVSLYATSPAGRAVTLAAEGSDDSGEPVVLAWDTDGDGAFDDPGGSATGAAPTVQLAVGEHALRVRATDVVGNTATDDVVVRVLDNVPVAVAGADVSAVEGAAVALDGAGSSDVEGGLSYAWDLGDGTTAQGATVAHAFADDGTYTVTLDVTDGAGQSARDTLTVTVSNADPVADAGDDRIVPEGAAVTLLGSGTDPGAADVLSYAWDLGDGTTAEGARPTHAYRDDGVYVATLTVRDDDGATATDTVRFDVRNVPPTAEAGAAIEVDEGGTAVLAGSATDPGLDDALTFSWSVDGVVLEGATVEHTFERDGNVPAYLAVRDDDGGTGSDTVLVRVRNVPPQVTLPDALVVAVGATLDHDLAPWDASPADRATLRVTWTLTDRAADAVLATGEDRRVAWFADARRGDVGLEVSVADDDVRIERACSVVVVTPAPGEVVEVVLRAALAPAVEKRVLAALVAADRRARPGAPRPALRKALRSVRKAWAALGGTAPEDLAAALDALDADLADGLPPRAAPGVTDLPDAPDTAQMLAVLPRAGLDGGGLRSTVRALLRLRDAERRGLPAKRLDRLREAAAKAARRLPDGDVARWILGALGG